MASKASNTGKKKGSRSNNPNLVEAGKATQFKPRDPETGEIDPRINTHGRPKSFDEVRKLFQAIGEQEITLNGKKYTRAEAIGLAMSADKKLMRDFLEYAYGRVPSKIEGTGADSAIKIVVEYANTDRNPTDTP